MAFKNSRLPWFSCWPSWFEAPEFKLAKVEHVGVLFRMLLDYWRMDHGGLPINPTVLAHLYGVPIETIQEAQELIGIYFKRSRNKKQTLRCPLLDVARKDALAQHEKYRNAANARWHPEKQGSDEHASHKPGNATRRDGDQIRRDKDKSGSGSGAARGFQENGSPGEENTIKGSQPPTDIQTQEREWMIQNLFEGLWPEEDWNAQKASLVSSLSQCKEGDLERAGGSVKDKRARREKFHTSEIGYFIDTARGIAADRKQGK